MKSVESVNFISIDIGKIALYHRQNQSTKTPIIFLHGVYFDHHLWDDIIKELNDRTVISIDMPLHGLSKEINKHNWNLHDCAEMLIEILDKLQLKRVIAVGHSWGSMTILRAANIQSERFESVLLCNMPFQAATKKQKMIFNLQHSLLIFRNFYVKQASKALFGSYSLKQNPKLINQLKQPMSVLSNNEIKQIDRKVIIEAEDSNGLIMNLKCKAIALKGEEDYLSFSPFIKNILVKGGHISPIETPTEILKVIGLLLNL
ncbi:MAG: alpha/beta fold hydrolase [Bacteroidota bacterium]|jgi:3-oxoadipate enol-lactonase